MPITLRHHHTTTTTTTHVPTPTTPSSPTANLLSHILIQTDQGRLSDTSIRHNRIVTVVDRTSHASYYYHHLGNNFNDYDNYDDDHDGCTWRRCTFQPMLYAFLLVVLVTCSLLVIVRGEAMHAAFPLTTTKEQGKWRFPKNGDGDGGGNSTKDDKRMGKGEERLGNGVLSDGGDERNGTAVLDDDDDDGALLFLGDEYTEDTTEDMSSGGKKGPTVEEEDGIESTLSSGEESLNSISMVDSNDLTNDTIVAEDVGSSESLVVRHTDKSTTNASNISLLMTLSINATSNPVVENLDTMSTIAIPTDESENLDQPLR